MSLQNKECTGTCKTLHKAPMGIVLRKCVKLMEEDVKFYINKHREKYLTLKNQTD